MHGIHVFGFSGRLQNSFVRFVILVVFCGLVLVGCTHGRAMKKGEMLFGRGEYVEALVAFEEALAAKPTSEQAAAGAAASRRQIVLGLIAEGKVALDKDEAGEALGYFERASAMPGKFDELQEFGDILVQRTVELAESEVNKGKYVWPLDIYERFGQSIAAERYDFETRRFELSEEWAARLFRSGQEQLVEGRMAYALLLFAKAAALTGDHGYQVRRDQVWHQIKPQLAYSVRVNREVNRSTVAWDGPSFVSDPSNLVQIMVNVAGKSTDATVQVFELSPTILHQESTTYGEVEYQSDVREVANPDYEYYERKLNGVERRLMDSEREVTTQQANVARRQLALERAREREQGDSNTYTRAALNDLESAHKELEKAYRNVQSRRDEVQRARYELNRTPKTVQEPVYSIYQFPIVNYFSRGSIQVEYAISHADGRSEIRRSKTLELEFSDHEHDAHPIIQLGAKYLDLPSDSLIEARLMQLAVDEIMKGVQDSYDSYRASVLDRVGEITEPGEKVDALVRYLLLSSRVEYPELNDAVYEIVGIHDTQNVLSTLIR